MENNLDKKYLELLQDILDNGSTKMDRTGTGTLSVFGRQIRHKMSEGFPLLTTKKMAWKTMVTELLWFLRGDTNINYLIDNNCHIWDGDAIKKWIFSGKCYKFRRNLYIEPKFEILSVDEVNDEDFPYINSTGFYGFEKDGIEELWVNFSKLGEIEIIQKFISDGFIYKIKTDDEFAKKFGELGPIYGKQWRSWDSYTVKPGLVSRPDGSYNENYWDYDQSIDQIQNLINDLKTNPDSRRLMVSAWSVHDLPNMVLPPCHYGFQVYTRELSLEERLTWMKNNKTNAVLPARDPNVEFSIDEFFRPYGVPTRAISLMYNARSQDVPLGTPFNLASYGLLLSIIAKETNMVPDELISNMGDCHIYLNQIDGVKEQLARTSCPLPQLVGKDEYHFVMNQDIPFSEKIDQFKPDFWELENYQSHPSIKMPLSN